ncbi:MAG: MoaD/ThiS family protein [Campylobacteraceae bacterium]|nr:MoaD/ThiS family protein [Campylobacteraceae bacterium]
MIKINLLAFSFLKKKLDDKNITNKNKEIQIKENMSVENLINMIGLDKDEVEGVFVNHKILTLQTILQDGDRVALVPPGSIPNHVKAYVGVNLV